MDLVVFKYLNSDYIGAASGIKYASRGDKVELIMYNEEMALIELNGERFHVKKERLSDVLIEKTHSNMETLVEPVKKQTKKKKIITQKQLF